MNSICDDLNNNCDENKFSVHPNHPQISHGFFMNMNHYFWFVCMKSKLKPFKIMPQWTASWFVVQFFSSLMYSVLSWVLSICPPAELDRMILGNLFRDSQLTFFISVKHCEGRESWYFTDILLFLSKYRSWSFMTSILKCPVVLYCTHHAILWGKKTKVQWSHTIHRSKTYQKYLLATFFFIV